MRKSWFVVLAAMLLVASVAQAAPGLTYSYPTTGTHGERQLQIVAADGATTIWTMRIYVPLEGADEVTHYYWTSGEICSFKDNLFGGTAFDYSSESQDVDGGGLFQLGGYAQSLGRVFRDGTSATDHSWQTAAYYEFTKSSTYTNTAGASLTAVYTVRINAPVMTDTNAYYADISSNLVITNNTALPQSAFVYNGGAGTIFMGLRDGGYKTGIIVNPGTSEDKPNAHLSDTFPGGDGHQLYKLWDWYGGKTAAGAAIAGFQGKAEVKANTLTVAANMRPGMTFEGRADGLLFTYNQPSNTMYGTTVVSTNTRSGVRFRLAQYDPFGTGYIIAGSGTATMSYTGKITAPQPVPVNVPDPTKCVLDVAPTAVAIDAPATVTVTIKNGLGNPMAGVAASDIVIAANGAGLTVVQPSTATDVNGQTTGTVSSSVGGDTKVITATVQSLVIPGYKLLFVQPAASNSSLSYVMGPDSGSWSWRQLAITATKDGGGPVWDMGVYVPLAGNTATGHAFWGAGQIASFKDTQFGSTFDYAGEASTVDTNGLFYAGGLSGEQYADSQTAAYYEMTKTGTFTAQAQPMGYIAITRIYAPVATADSFTSDIETIVVVDNKGTVSVDPFYGNGVFGNMGLALNTNVAYGLDWVFINPQDSVLKPNVHQTDASDDNPLYAVEDWYGTIVPPSINGALMHAKVKANADTAALGLRPNLAFTNRSDDMDMYYCLLQNGSAGHTYGASVNSETLALLTCSIINQPNAVGSTYVAPGTMRVLRYFSKIEAPAAPSGFTLTVNGGSGSGTYASGTVVAIVADPPQAGQMFVNWTGDVGTVDNASAASTTITMNGNYVITANYGPLPVVGVTAALSGNWVYQNTPVTTGDRHVVTLSLTVTGSTTFTVAVTKNVSSVGDVTIESTADPLVWVLRGSARPTGVISGVGDVNLDIVVTDTPSSVTGSTTALVVSRQLGDIDGANGVSGQDKLLMNKRLNGLVPDGPEYDLDAQNGSSGQDKLILNKILNGLTIP